jgi:hypothetical protein
MTAQNRFLAINRIWDAETILTPSSEVATLPASFLQDQLRQKLWRTLTGWTIVAGFNDKLDVNRGGGGPGDFTVTIPAGTYVSGTDLAEAIRVGLEAADPTPLWGVDYGIVAADKFRIRDAAGAPLNFALEWATGANAATSIGKCLGFDTATDDSGTNTYTANLAAYQSRHYLKINRSDGETIQVTVAALLEHNILNSASIVKLQANATDVWSAPTKDINLDASSTDPLVHFLGSDAYVLAWTRLLIEDVQNPVGYFELAIFYLGQSSAPSINVSQDLANAPEDFSSVEAGIDGTHFRDAHRRRDRWTLAYLEMDASTRAILDEAEGENPVGKNFFFVWDVNAPDGHGDGIDGTTYGYLAAPFSQNYVPGPYWTYAAPFHEAL